MSMYNTYFTFVFRKRKGYLFVREAAFSVLS
nr:MAG TPA: hypothetical protein [Caudoviricetes sp.]